MRISRLKYISGFILALTAASCGRSDAHKEFDAVADEVISGQTPTQQKDYSNKIPNRPSSAMSAGPGRLPVRMIGSLRELFNDSNHVQLQYARTLGIEPITNIRDAYCTRRPVVMVKSNKFYQVDSLKHSLPFLVPEAERLLSDIGRNFIDTLKSRGGSGYRIKVTSLLRTSETVKRLRRVNINATQESTHQFGTTFDISYTKFHPVGNAPELHDGDLKNLLAEVLLDLRDRGRCLVKFERHTSCFHVTATQ